MDDIVTQVIITGKKGDDERTPIEATVKGDTDKYGTVQKKIHKDEDAGIDESKKEAQELLDEKGKPKETYHLKDVIDIPFVHKGDIIKINAGDLAHKYCLITDITHDAQNKTMDIDGEPWNNSAEDGGNSGGSGDYTAGKALSLNNVPLYISSDAASKSTTVSGTYYLYDGIEILGRFRITNSQSRVGAKPIGGNVTGWIDKEYI